MDRKKIIALVIILSGLFLVMLGYGLKKDLKKIEENEKKVSVKSAFEDTKKEMNISKSDNRIQSNNAIREKVITKYISEFIYHINKKEFEKAFDMLDKEYIEDFNITLETFKKSYDFKKEKYIKFKNIETSYLDRNIAKTYIMDQDGKNFIRKYFTVINNYNERYSFVDRGIKNKIKINLQKKIKNILKATLHKEYEISQGFVYIITLENISDTEVELSSNSWSFYTIENSIKKNYISLGYYSDKKKIMPGEKIRYTILFSTEGSIRNLYITLEDGREIQIYNMEDLEKAIN